MAAEKGPIIRAVLAVVFTAAAVVWLVFYFNPSRKQMEGRTQDEKEYVYKCTGGHIFTAYGRKAPRPCAFEGCKEEAYLYQVFACPQGDRIGIFLRTDPDQFRFEDYSSEYEWRPFDIDEFMDIPCPRCGTPGLMPAPEAPG